MSSTGSSHHHRPKAIARAEARLGVTTEYTDLSLHSASANGNLGLVKYALLNGQPVNSVLNGVLPLHAAASSGNEATVRMLIEYGADVNAPRLPRRHSNDRSKSSGIAVGTAGSTPLHFAAANGHANIISILLSYGAKVTATEKYGHTAENLAIQRGHADVAELLRSWQEEEADAASSSGTSLHSVSKHRRMHPKRSFDALALKLSQHTSTGHLPNLHFPNSGSSTSINNVIPSPTATASNLNRRASLSSTYSQHLSDGPNPRRPSLPSVFEKAAHPTSALKQALGMSSIRRGSVGESSSLRRSSSKGSISSFFGKKDDDDSSITLEGEDSEKMARRRSDDLSSSKASRRGSIGSLLGSRLRDPPGTAPPTKTAFYPSEIAGGSSGGSVAHSILMSGNNSSSGSISNVVAAQPGVTPPPSNPFYRPRQSSQLSGRINSSPLISTPSTFEDEGEGQARGEATAPGTIALQRESSTASSSRGTPDSALIEVAQRRLGNRPRTDSVDSASSALSRRNPIFAKSNSLHPAEGVAGVVGGPIVDGKRIETRSSRSNSAGTDGRFSSSPASSYSGSGPGALSTYAPSSTTTATSAAPSSPTSQYVARQPLLAPLYEASNASNGRKKLSDQSTVTITTSAEAHNRVKRVERELLNYNPSEASSKDDDGKTSLRHQLAAYGQSLSLERKLKAIESTGKPGTFTFETIASGGTRSAPEPATKATPTQSHLAISSTPVPKSPLHAASAEELGAGKTPVAVPQWRAVPTVDRLMPPSPSGRRSTSPSSAASSNVPRKPKVEHPTKLSSSALGQISNPPTRTSSPSNSSNSAGANGISYVEVVPPPSSSGTPRRTHHHSASKSGKGSSVTSAKDQVTADALEQARIEAAIPQAKITVQKKQPKGFRKLFSSSKNSSS